eukprot:533797-Rhodomonas_salina.1
MEPHRTSIRRTYKTTMIARTTDVYQAIASTAVAVSLRLSSLLSNSRRLQQQNSLFHALAGFHPNTVREGVERKHS